MYARIGLIAGGTASATWTAASGSTPAFLVAMVVVGAGCGLLTGTIYGVVRARRADD